MRNGFAIRILNLWVNIVSCTFSRFLKIFSLIDLSEIIQEENFQRISKMDKKQY